MKKVQKGMRMIGCVVVVILVLFCAFFCSNGIKKNLSEESVNNLRAMSRQSAKSVEKEIDYKFILLNSISDDLCMGEDLSERVKRMKSFVKQYQFKRMGFIDTDGMAVTTDGYTKDLSERAFYKKGMNGQSCVTDAMQDTIGDKMEDVNVFSVPVYGSDKKIKGVLFATIQTSIFSDVIMTDAFSGKGYTYIINDDGKVIATAGCKQRHKIENIFTSMQKTSKDSKQRAQVQSDMKNHRTGTYFGKNDVNQFFYYYQRLNIKETDNNWYILSAVPEKVLSDQMTPIMRDINMLILIVAGVLLVATICYVYLDRRRRKELYQLAYVDSVTGGENFAAFRQKARRKKDVKSGYFIAMDISEFKLINSVCGIKKGDEVLGSIWTILKRDSKSDELIARVNADRFVLFWMADSKENLIQRIEKLVQEIEGISQQMSIPRLFPLIGVYETDTLEEVDKCYGNARRAKNLIKNRRDRHYAFFDELDFDSIVRDRELEDKFESAIANHKFEIWYQPKYGANTRKIVGAEALIRWRDEDGKIIMPGRFIPLFERNGNIIKLDEYVFRAVCKQQQQWQQEGRRLLPVSVNISRVSLYYSNVVEKYKEILQSCSMNPKYVQLEITESATIGNADIAQLIENFHLAGFKILLDDFGTGYSSLATLNEMHFDTIKLDKSLVDYIGNENGEKLLHFITMLAQSLGMEITAEGVETDHQLVFLRDLKCDDIQGYYFSKPLSRADYEQLQSENKEIK